MFEDNLTIRETKRVQKHRNAVILVVVLIMLTILPKLFLGGVFFPNLLNNIDAYKNLMPADKMILGLLYGTVLSTVLIYIFAKKYLNHNDFSMGLKNPNRVKNYFKGAMFGFALITGVFLQLKIRNLADISPNYQNVNPGIFLIFFIGWVLQGFSEELMARSVLMNYFVAENGVKLAIIANSLIFSIMHLGNDGFGVFPFINIFLMGVIFSLMFYVSDDIFFPAAAHTFWNFAQGNIYGINVSGISQSNISLLKTQLVGNQFLTGGAFGVEGGFLTFWMEVMAIMLLLAAVNNKNKNTSKEYKRTF